MNGLFSRLAEQSINQRDISVKQVRTPVFSTESTRALDHIEDHHQEPVQASPFSESLHPLAQPGFQRTEDTNDVTRNDSLVHESSRPLSAKPHLASALTARKDRAVLKDYTTKSNMFKGAPDQEIVAHIETLEVPAIQPQIQNQTATVIKDKNPLGSTDEDVKPKQFQSSTLDSAAILPQSLVMPISKKYSTMVTRRNGNQVSATQKTTLSETEMATINVSIGQIDIKATSSETPTLKKTHQSNRKPSISLDDYQQKRQRGGR